MQRKMLLQQAREFVRAQEDVIAPLSLSEEEIDPQTQHDLSVRANPLEPTNACYPIKYDPKSDSMYCAFRYFEDGRQKTLLLGYIPISVGRRSLVIPVHYCVVSAVILQRIDRKLRLWREAIVVEGICVERSLLANQRIADDFEQSGLRIIDTKAVGGDYHYLRSRALHMAKVLRLHTEDALIESWRTSPEASDAYLVVDGTLMNFRSADNVERCVAVSKSSTSRYFDLSSHTRIMQMEQYQRSWAFRFKSPQDDASLGGKDRLSWYLRLRTQPGCDVEFGLIRVEISTRHSGKVSELANEISRYLLSESLPTSYPYPRWDRHLFPIRACETYLESIVPTNDTIRAAMQGSSKGLTYDTHEF
jgi:hypothetical protein